LPVGSRATRATTRRILGQVYSLGTRKSLLATGQARAQVHGHPIEKPHGLLLVPALAHQMVREPVDSGQIGQQQSGNRTRYDDCRQIACERMTHANSPAPTSQEPVLLPRCGQLRFAEPKGAGFNEIWTGQSGRTHRVFGVAEPSTSNHFGSWKISSEVPTVGIVWGPSLHRFTVGTPSTSLGWLRIAHAPAHDQLAEWKTRQDVTSPPHRLAAMQILTASRA